MVDLTGGIRVGIFNARGLSKRPKVVNRMSKETMVLGICETWIKDDQDPARHALDETAIAPSSRKAKSGRRGVSLVVNLVLRYKTVDKLATQTIQFISVKLSAIKTTVMYLSPSADKNEEAEVFSQTN